MNGKKIIERCFDDGLGAITIYGDEDADLTKNHDFEICCSAKYDSNEGFDICKSFVM